jgi:hypothetical protein
MTVESEDADFMDMLQVSEYFKDVIQSLGISSDEKVRFIEAESKLRKESEEILMNMKA